MLKNKMEVGSLYIGILFITIVLSFVLRFLKVDYSIGYIFNFAIALYIFFDLIVTNEKAMGTYRIFFVVYLFYNVFVALNGLPEKFDVDFINSLGIGEIVNNCVLTVGFLLISLYVSGRFFVKSDFMNSEKLYLTVNGLGFMMSVVEIVVFVMEGKFILLGIVSNLLLLAMRLLFIRYAYLSKVVKDV